MKYEQLKEWYMVEEKGVRGYFLSYLAEYFWDMRYYNTYYHYSVLAVAKQKYAK